MSPKWTTIRIHVGGSRPREFVRLSRSNGCLLAKIVVLALTVFAEGSNLDGIGRRPPPSGFFLGQ